MRHLGPMAQDFYAAFALGEDDEHIASLDIEGVGLAAIQGLFDVVQERDSQLMAQQEQLSSQEQHIEVLEAQVATARTENAALQPSRLRASRRWRPARALERAADH